MNRQTAILTLISTLDAYLSEFDGPGIADVRAGIARHRDGLFREVTPGRIDATKHVDAALDWMEGDGQSALGGAIATAMPWLRWGGYDPYPRDEIGEKYATNHAAASLIGAGGHLPADGFDLGLFAFGPETLYRDHHHAAPELYAPFTGPHGWRFSSGEKLDWRPAHQPVWNEAWAPHAIRSGPQPFLCLYCWIKDAAIPARMIREPDWAELEIATAPEWSLTP